MARHLKSVGGAFLPVGVLSAAAIVFLFLGACSKQENANGGGPSKSAELGQKHFVVTGPDGRKFRVSTPIGSTRTDAIKYVALKFYGISDQASGRSTFAGYSCTNDCGGHEAGYQWAEEQGITDPDECGGNSLSFEEGCRAYAEEQ